MMDRVFGLSGLLVMPFWFLMIFLPRFRWTRRIMESPLVVIAPALLYAALVLPVIREVFPIVNQPSLATVAPLLGSPAGATIAWVHFLAFDLFVGRWVYLDSRDRDISPWLMAPVLYLTLMLGPLGFSLYLAVRAIAARSPRAVVTTAAPRRAGEA
ncbi:ABA4-like family protein [Sorangium sp. So ce117]|uniref:ABA4-like family protein n=1 Tax=Sorangium sp. So ce117 TaxID=3133277 RepID=UPI003F631B03